MIEIKRLQKEDVKQVVLLEEACLNETLGVDLLTEELEKDHAYFYCAKEGLKVIGYISAYIFMNEAEILNFCVYETYRRRGIGQMLFNEILKNNLTKITLEVRENNIIGKSFYLKNGFTEVSKRKHYYKDGEDAIVMIKGGK